MRTEPAEATNTGTTSAEIRTQAEASVSASEDAFLAGIFPGKPPAPKVEVAETKAEEQAPDGRSAAGSESESKKADEETESDPEWEKASTVLALDGVPVAMLAKLDRAEVLEWASKAKERQAKTAQELKARTERIKALESAATTPKAETSKEAPTAKVGDPGELKALEEAFGAELAAPLAKLLERTRSEVQERYDREIGVLSSILEKNLINSAKAGLREHFPQVDDPEKFAELRKEMPAHIAKYRDAGLDAEESYQSAMRDAARVLFFEEVQASNAGKALASYRKRLASQPTPPTGKPPMPKAMTAAEREDALLEAIFKGDVEAKERLMRAS
jgi:hypothetical protein